MILSGNSFEATCLNKFVDFPKYDWGCKYAEAGLMLNYFAPNKYFNPESNISKWESLKMIMKSRGIPKAEGFGRFYPRAYMEGALSAGLITTAFKDYNQAATRGWMFKIAANSLDYSKGSSLNELNELNDESGLENESELPSESDLDNFSLDDLFSGFEDEVEYINDVEEVEIESWNNKRVSMSYNGNQEVVGYINKPKGNSFDVIIALHGSVDDDSVIEEAAINITNITNQILETKDKMIIGVAYREEGILIGDNISDIETALLWTKEQMENELGVKPNKIFVFGHGEGGYLATKLNTRLQTDGVLVSGVEPIDLSKSCKTDESLVKLPSKICIDLINEFGTVSYNSGAFKLKSAIGTALVGHKSNIVFVQGMDDGMLDVDSWNELKFEFANNVDDRMFNFVEIDNAGNGAILETEQGRNVFNDFIR